VKILHGWFSAYDTKLVAMSTSLHKLKKKCRSVNSTKNVFIWWKDCENRPGGSWDNWSLFKKKNYGR